MKKTWPFIRRIVSTFVANKGILLAGGVAYNTLLSVVPMFAVLLVVLSHFTDEQELLAILSTELELIAPGKADLLAVEFSAFLDNRDLVGGIGVLVLLFFSSIAFRMMEDAFGVIFRTTRRTRSFWVSAAIPYVYMTLLGVALMTLTTANIAIEAMDFFPDGATSVLLDFAGIGGMTLMFASLYRILPLVRVSFTRCIAGGVATSLLWEVIRNGLVWYFGNVSLVNVIYGSLASVIIVLLCMEIAAIILLLGAQVLAELERSARHGLPWWERAPDGEWSVPPKEESPPDPKSNRLRRRRQRRQRR